MKLGRHDCFFILYYYGTLIQGQAQTAQERYLGVMRKSEVNMDYLVPDYYEAFHCKIGQCRTPCCEGWPVTFSMSDYFKLLSTECSPELKRRLDNALHLTEQPTREEYGMLLPRYDGTCAMRMEDGRCGLQVEAGEDALPSVCRQYPRSIRSGECCCTNSCEAVIEQLDRQMPIRFQIISREEAAAPQSRAHFFETCGREMEIRLWLIGFVQDRSIPLGQRLNRLGEAVRRLDEALAVRDFDKVNELLTGKTPIAAVELHGDRAAALEIVGRLLARLDDLSDSIREYGQEALRRFDQEGRISENEIARRMNQVSAHYEAWFENVMVNHMYFAQFPFQDRPVSLKDETIALYAIYGLLRFLAVGAGDGTHERMADILAALFRLVDHTAFDRYAVPILKQICGESAVDSLLVL